MHELKHQNKESVPFNTPILFTIFNRPDVTEIVFDTIRNIKPTALYISADGPRENRIDENDLCEKTRKITENVDWPCKVYRKYSNKNLGCKIGMSSAINWFFENVNEGIILEDDCLPDITFFTFCRELLDKYRDANQIKMITGDNFNFGRKFSDESYYFSHIPSIWGWATWKRAWKEYDLEMSTYPTFKKNNTIKEIFECKNIQKHWIKHLDKLYNGKIDTWDGQLAYSIWNNKGITITPAVNLVSNIGFNDNATHTKKQQTILNNIERHNLNRIIHPINISINKEADMFVFKNVFYKSLVSKILMRLTRKI